MRKGLCIVAFLVLAAQLPLLAYDTSPSLAQVVPEAIWAAATGGGTWVTEIQIVSLGIRADYINAVFCYSGGSTGPFVVATFLDPNKSVRFSNILSTLDALDSSAFDYYGRVGSVLISTSGIGTMIHVQARTVNGNYGKTFPGLNLIAGNSAGDARSMFIQDLVQNATYRTSVGACNLNSGLVAVRFRIVDGDGVQVGNYFDKALLSMGFISFNPFKEAGVPTGTYENCHLTVEVLTWGATGFGVYCYGSIANNSTNDTYAMLAKQYPVS